MDHSYIIPAILGYNGRGDKIQHTILKGESRVWPGDGITIENYFYRALVHTVGIDNAYNYCINIWTADYPAWMRRDRRNDWTIGRKRKVKAETIGIRWTDIHPVDGIGRKQTDRYCITTTEMKTVYRIGEYRNEGVCRAVDKSRVAEGNSRFKRPDRYCSIQALGKNTCYHIVKFYRYVGRHIRYNRTISRICGTENRRV